MIRLNDIDAGYTIARTANVNFNPEVDPVISRVDQSGALRGGVIFQNYTERSICVHMAGYDPHWANRDLLWTVFDYAFNQLGCEWVLAQVPSHNEEALAIDKKLGFKELTRIPDVFPDGDMIVLRMRREECKWLSVTPRTIKSNRVT